MDNRSVDNGDRSIVQWGGIAGMLGAVLLLIVFGIVGTFVGADPATPEGLVARFPGIRIARIAENGLYLAVMALWIIHVMAVARVLGRTHPALALAGQALATLGLAVLAVGALPHIATAPISELYHAPDATPEQRAALVPLWLAVQGIFDALLVTGLLVAPLGIIAFGLAMRTPATYGARIGGLAMALGAAAFAAAVINLIEVSGIAAISVFALILFNLAVGWRTYRLSRRPSRLLQGAVAMPARP